MKKEIAINLFGLIRDLKNSNLSREALVKYIMLRVKLKSLFDEFEKAREEISEQVKPSTSARVQFYGDFMLRGNAPPSQGTQITTGMTMKAVYNNISINLGTIPSVTYQYDANLP